MLEDRKATYVRIVVDYLPQKEYPYRTRLTLGGNLINYHGDVGTPTTKMLVSKLLSDSVLLTPYAKFMGIDSKSSTSTRRWPDMSI